MRAGLFRIAVARSQGGAEADPRAQILAIEAIPEADGAAGWTLMIGIESLGIASAMLRPDVAEQVIAKHPEVVFSGAPARGAGAGRGLPRDRHLERRGAARVWQPRRRGRRPIRG